MKNTILIFSTLTLCILLLFQISKFAFIKGNLDWELIVSIIAIAFFFLGVVINKSNSKKKGQVENSTIDYLKIKELNISNREYDVLVALSENLSNKDISDKLFISLSTTKTHVSRLFSKLDVSKRIDAVNKAKVLKII